MGLFTSDDAKVVQLTNELNEVRKERDELAEKVADLIANSVREAKAYQELEGKLHEKRSNVQTVVADGVQFDLDDWYAMDDVSGPCSNRDITIVDDKRRNRVLVLGGNKVVIELRLRNN